MVRSLLVQRDYAARRDYRVSFLMRNFHRLILRKLLRQITFRRWQTMDAQLTPGRYLLGETLSVLDLYVAMVSRFGPWRDRFYREAPRMTPAIRRVDEHPRLQTLWAARFPAE